MRWKYMGETSKISYDQTLLININVPRAPSYDYELLKRINHPASYRLKISSPFFLFWAENLKFKISWYLINWKCLFFKSPSKTTNKFIRCLPLRPDRVFNWSITKLKALCAGLFAGLLKTCLLRASQDISLQRLLTIMLSSFYINDNIWIEF